jgi:hypothetical protein
MYASLIVAARSHQPRTRGDRPNNPIAPIAANRLSARAHRLV